MWTPVAGTVEKTPKRRTEKEIDAEKNAVAQVIDSAPELFNRVPHGYANWLKQLGPKTIAVVGNGALSEGVGRQIDTFDVVVRCNSFRRYDSDAEGGKRCDIILLNGRSQKHILDYSEDFVLNVVVEGVHTELNEWACECEQLQSKYVCTLHKSIWKRLSGRTDNSTGFMAVLAMTKLSRNVCIFGMEGQGHLNNPNAKIWHNVAAEHRLYHNMIAEGALHQAHMIVPTPPEPIATRKGKRCARKPAAFGRGSHPVCASARCHKWAKAARPAVSSYVIAKYKKRVALCFSCQTALQRRISAQ